MRRHHFRVIVHLAPAVVLLGTLVTAAHADPITTPYTITDLGTGTITATASNGNKVAIDPGVLGQYGQGNNALTAAVNGSQVIGVSNGQSVYAFVASPETAVTAYQGIMTNFPLAAPAPVNAPNTFGDPLNAYSVVTGAVMNRNGIVAAIDSMGVAGHQGADTAYYVQRNADGSWGPPAPLWNGTTQFGQGPVGGVSITGINNLNQVLGQMSVQPNVPADAVVYNIKTNSLTDLTNYLIANGYNNVLPLAIDDLGRILVEAGQGTSGGEHILILSPDGVSGDPLLAPVPEPSSLAVIALAVAAFAIHRALERRRPRPARAA